METAGTGSHTQAELHLERKATLSNPTKAQQQQQQQQQQQASCWTQTFPLTLNQAAQQAQFVNVQSQGAQTDVRQQESCSTQTLTADIHVQSQQTQSGPGLEASKSQLTQTPLQSQQAASTQTQRHQAHSSQHTQTMLPKQKAALVQTDNHAMQQASQHTQTIVLLQQHGSTQTNDYLCQLSQHSQTHLVLQTSASTQTTVETADTASQCQSLDEQASAAEQRIVAMQGEMAGLQLKVQSLQGIVDIQEQQLKAAAGQNNSDAQQVHICRQCTRSLLVPLLTCSQQTCHTHSWLQAALSVLARTLVAQRVQS